VNDPASLVCESERLIVRVSPLAIADSVEVDANPNHKSNGAQSTCAKVPLPSFETSKDFSAGKIIPSARLESRLDIQRAHPRIERILPPMSPPNSLGLCHPRHIMAKKRPERQRRVVYRFDSADSTLDFKA
jgi:hypothetical protein